MLADIADGTLGAVVAWDLDRLHRRPIELEAFMSLADDKHLALATVSGDVDLSTAQGRLVARLKGSVAAHEIEHKKARQIRAAQQKAERGEPNWSQAFGYHADTRQPDPVTAPLVKQGYAAILAGASLGDICRQWNAPGRTRAPAAVDRRHVSSSYAGHVTPDCATTRATSSARHLAAPVDESTWRAAQTVLDAPERKPGRKSVRRHLLTGVATAASAGTTCRQLPTDGRIIYRARNVTVCRSGRERGAHRVRHRVRQASHAGRRRFAQNRTARRGRGRALRIEKNALLAELDSIGVERGDGLLTVRQAKIATDLVTGETAAIQGRQQDQERMRVFDGLPLGGPEVADAIKKLSPDRFRAVLDVLADITVAPVGKGGREFQPERVQVVWR